MKKFVSIFEAKTGNLHDYVADLAPDGIHIDVADGHAVANLGVPLWIVPHLPKIPVHIHLMTKPTEIFIDMALAVGPEIIFIHPKWCDNPEYVVRSIEAGGSKAGIVWDGDDSAEYLDLASTLLCMTVVPGKSGQGFIYERLEAIRDLVKMHDVWVDGGINREIIAQVDGLGIQGVVVGSAAEQVFLGGTNCDVDYGC